MYSPISFYIQVYEACDDFEPVVERLNGFLEQVFCPDRWQSNLVSFLINWL